jgi:hypothetical protein
LIEAGWDVLKSDFDETAFQKWRREAFQCLTEMLGPKHPYTNYFKEHVHRPQRAALLTGRGILCAAKEEMVNRVD